MRRKQRSHRIGGFEYEVTQLPATEGFRVLTVLLEALGPSFSGLIASLDLSGGVSGLFAKSIDQSAVASALNGLWPQLSNPRVLEVVQQLAGETAVFGEGLGSEGAPLDRCFDDHFAGRFGELGQWLWFALTVNYGNFTAGSGLGGLLDRLAELAPAEPGKSTASS